MPEVDGDTLFPHAVGTGLDEALEIRLLLVGAGSDVVHDRLSVKALEYRLDAYYLLATIEEHDGWYVGHVQPVRPFVRREAFASRRDHGRVTPAVELDRTKAPYLLEGGRLFEHRTVQLIAARAVLLLEEDGDRLVRRAGTQVIRGFLEERLRVQLAVRRLRCDFGQVGGERLDRLTSFGDVLQGRKKLWGRVIAIDPHYLAAVYIEEQDRGREHHLVLGREFLLGEDFPGKIRYRPVTPYVDGDRIEVVACVIGDVFLAEIAVEQGRAIGAPVLAEIDQQALAVGAGLGRVLLEIQERTLEPGWNGILPDSVDLRLFGVQRHGHKPCDEADKQEYDAGAIHGCLCLVSRLAILATGAPERYVVKSHLAPECHASDSQLARRFPASHAESIHTDAARHFRGQQTLVQ